MRAVYLLLFLFLFAELGAQTLTLEACIERALSQNLNLKQQALAVSSSQIDLQQQRAQRHPSLNGYATHNYNWGQRIDPFTNQFANQRVQSNSLGVSADVNLFNGFQTHYAIKAQQVATEAAQSGLEVQQNQIALNVAGQYLSALLAIELVEVARFQVRVSEEQVARVKALFDAGAANGGSLLELEAQLARDRATLIGNENDVKLALLQLRQLLAMPADAELTLEREEVNLDEFKSLNPSEIYAAAESRMPEIKQATLGISSAEWQLKQSKSAYYPSLSLSGGLGSGYSGLSTQIESITISGTEQIGTTASGEGVFQNTFSTELSRTPVGTQLNDNFNQFLGLSLGVPIYNRRSAAAAEQRSTLAISQQQLALDLQKQALRQSIERAYTDASAAEAQWRASVMVEQSAAKSFEFIEARYAAGAASAVEFNTAKANWQLAQGQLVVAKFDLLFKRKVLQFYAGQGWY